MNTHCGHWDARGGRACGAGEGVRAYLAGPRRQAHTPAAHAGRAEPAPDRTPPNQSTMEYRAQSEALLRHAIRYAERGWPVFLLGRTKRPLANCDACNQAGRREHDPEACDFLTCHVFYAATTDPGRLAAMCQAHPRGLLAIRTGTVADLAVVDIDPRNGGALARGDWRSRLASVLSPPGRGTRVARCPCRPARPRPASIPGCHRPRPRPAPVGARHVRRGRLYTARVLRQMYV